jgi:hypothetical protein
LVSQFPNYLCCLNFTFSEEGNKPKRTNKRISRFGRSYQNCIEHMRFSANSERKNFLVEGVHLVVASVVASLSYIQAKGLELIVNSSLKRICSWPFLLDYNYINTLFSQNNCNVLSCYQQPSFTPVTDADIYVPVFVAKMSECIHKKILGIKICNWMQLALFFAGIQLIGLSSD